MTKNEIAVVSVAAGAIVGGWTLVMYQLGFLQLFFYRFLHSICLFCAEHTISIFIILLTLTTYFLERIFNRTLA